MGDKERQNPGVNNFFKKPFRWAAVFSVIMSLSVTYVLLDTFVIPRAGTPITAASSTETKKTASSGQTVSSKNTSAVISDTSYKDDNIQITIDTVRAHDTTMYVADIQLSSVEYFKTAFANGTYGRNIKQTTSDMAEENNAIFAVNGDYYGFRDYGFVLRNGVLYRDTGSGEAMAIDSTGNMSIIDESTTDAQTLVDKKVKQVLSFGPTLINNGKITVNSSSEVSQAMTSNPRTAIGQISPLHYIVIVSDGRTSESTGLSLLQLAQEFSDKGCTVAYNLDGGGSSTMWFNGKVVNNPTTNGRSTSERSVSDIVYFGY